jgi:hypothetical protein
MERSDTQWNRAIARFKSARAFLQIARFVLMVSALLLLASSLFFQDLRGSLAGAAGLASWLLLIAQLFWRQVQNFEQTFQSEIENHGPPNCAV